MTDTNNNNNDDNKIKNLKKIINDDENKNITVTEIIVDNIEKTKNEKINDNDLEKLPTDTTIKKLRNEANSLNFNKDTDNNTNKIKNIKEIGNENNKNDKDNEDIDEKQTLFHNIKDLFNGMDIDSSNIMVYLTRTVETVDMFFNGTGEEKKELVIRTIFDLLDDNIDIDASEKEFIKLLLDSLIETVIKTSRKQLSFDENKNKNSFTKKMLKQFNNKNLSIGQIIELIIDKTISIIKKNDYDNKQIIIQFPIIIGMIINIVDNYKNLSRSEKKTIIIKVVKNLITEKIPEIIEIEDDEQQKFDLIIQILPSIIDILVEIIDGKYNINKIKSIIKRIFSCCKCCRK